MNTSIKALIYGVIVGLIVLAFGIVIFWNNMNWDTGYTTGIFAGIFLTLTIFYFSQEE